MLQIGRSRDRVPLRWIFSIDLILPAAKTYIVTQAEKDTYPEYAWDKHVQRKARAEG
jgi:hypothetical protein